MACGILVPQPGMEPMPPAVEVQSKPPDCQGGPLDFFIIVILPGGSVGKESAYSAGDSSSIPELGRSPGEGNGNPLQDSCLENFMNRGAWWAIVHGVVRV